MPSACNRKRGMRAWVPSGDASERKLPVPVVEIIGFLLPYPVNQSTRRRIAGCRGFGQNLFHPCIRRELFALLDADRGPEAERGQAPKRAAIILQAPARADAACGGPQTWRGSIVTRQLTSATHLPQPVRAKYL